MFTKQDLQSLGENIVYLKPVATQDLPEEVRAQAGDLDVLFAVHNTKGEQVALVASEGIATHLAAEHHMQLVTLH
ncbi:DUF1150 family protein [Loktanella sp. M215]|uniref:DUF1150 family protein n=1 Tax=Loktanella sp. M215 TaxID=2675431 RepID=UPI001F1B576A|nr:DUF1150 family protein [Loktanella sp. M215]MBU2358274.1 DUF1150 domain-containing protein [Alphaproteobacteria bacterium]MCF7698119.1 DUF1150 family protein [Loktanella sp. M215]